MEGLDWGAYYWFQFQRPRLPWLHEVMLGANQLAGPLILGLVAAATAIWLAASRRYRTALLFLGLFLGSVLLVEVLKLAVARRHPPDWNGRSVLAPFSFPSGHALLSAVAYLSLALLLVQRLAASLARLLVLGAGALLVFLSGASRFYLGQEFLTDVLAGWVAGTALVLAARVAHKETGRQEAV